MKKETPLQRERLQRIVEALKEYKNEVTEHGCVKNARYIWRKYGIGTLKKSLLIDIKNQDITEEFAEYVFDNSRSYTINADKQLKDFDIAEILDYAFNEADCMELIREYCKKHLDNEDIKNIADGRGMFFVCSNDTANEINNNPTFRSNANDWSIRFGYNDERDRRIFIEGAEAGRNYTRSVLKNEMYKTPEKDAEKTEMSVKDMCEKLFSDNVNFDVVESYVLAKFEGKRIIDIYLESMSTDAGDTIKHNIRQFAEHCADKVINANPTITRRSYVYGFLSGYRTHANSGEPTKIAELRKNVTRLGTNNGELSRKIQELENKINSGVESPVTFIKVDSSLADNLPYELPEQMMSIIKRLSVNDEFGCSVSLKVAEKFYKPDALALLKYKSSVSVMLFCKEFGVKSYRYFPLSHIEKYIVDRTEAKESISNKITFI